MEYPLVTIITPLQPLRLSRWNNFQQANDQNESCKLLYQPARGRI